MKKIVALLMLCLLLPVSGPAYAEDAFAEEARLDGFTVVPSKVTRDGEKFLIELTALYESTDAVREYIFFAVTFNDDGEMDKEALVTRYDQYNSLGHLHNICFLALLTPDGKPFPDNSRQWECGGGNEQQQPDGSWQRIIDFDGYSLHGDEEGVVVEFHMVTDDEPYTGEPLAKMFVNLK